MNGRVLIGILCITAMSCAHSAPAPVAAPVASEGPAYYGQETLQAVVWMQGAVEYRASAMQAYATATRELDAAIADRSRNAVSELTTSSNGELPPAIILDLDETCLDNSAYEADLLLAKQVHNETQFEKFIQSARSGAVPGSLAFLRYAESRGVSIFYVTNQNVKLEAATRANLERLGFPLPKDKDTVLTVAERPEWTSDKASRRLFVSQNYRVVMLFGDDFNDFVTATGKSVAERRAIFDRYADWFGTKWFVIPNPAYGSWDRAVTMGAGHSAKDKFDAKMKALRTSQGD